MIYETTEMIYSEYLKLNKSMTIFNHSLRVRRTTPPEGQYIHSERLSHRVLP